MTSYFTRHTDDLQVKDDDLKALWDENRIAVHFPDPKGDLGKMDSESTNPDHYGKSGKTAMRYFRALRDNGGYIWAEHFLAADGAAKVGYVEPGTKIKLCDVRWDLRGRPDFEDKRKNGDPAKLKTLKLSQVKEVTRRGWMGLRAGRPQRGTILKWKCGTRLEDIVAGKMPEPIWENLSTAQQEATCAEFLRVDHGSDIPVLRRLLLPVGRTMQDIDIYGVAADGREMFVQVTYRPRDRAESHNKAQALRPYGEGGAHLLFFCRGEGPKNEGSIRFIQVDREVESWLQSEPESYRDSLFR
jgi:hypothetical protein